MASFLMGMNENTSGCPFNEQAIQRCPFLRNINKPTNFSFTSFRMPVPEDSSTHEALGNEWLKKGNCPIAKSYRAVSGVLPFLASTLKPPRGLKLKCPRAVVAARAALARTSLVKNLRPQPLPEKMLVIGLLAVPFIAMLRKSVLMPKTAMVFTIAASILGQVIGSRAERFRTDVNGLTKGRCNTDGAMWNQFPRKGLRYESSSSSSAGVCF
nr:serine/arginine repetitive matrix protein [Tanacetum cinerariifolium]